LNDPRTITNNRYSPVGCMWRFAPLWHGVHSKPCWDGETGAPWQPAVQVRSRVQVGTRSDSQ